MAPIKEWFGLYNVIFNWFEEKCGSNALEEYWKFIGNSCFESVIEGFKDGNLEDIKRYYDTLFDIDNGGYMSSLENGRLIYDVTRCPDYEFMNTSDNPYFKPIGSYCKHHAVINSTIAESSGYRFMLEECSNKGQCRWIFEKEKGV